MVSFKVPNGIFTYFYLKLENKPFPFFLGDDTLIYFNIRNNQILVQESVGPS